MTAEGAGAGVQAGTLVLTVRPEGAAPVPLPLHEAEPLIGDWSGQPAVEAGVPMSLEVSGLPPRAAVTVRMGSIARRTAYTSSCRIRFPSTT